MIETVLVVDDNADLLQFMERILTKEGLKVLTASTVKEAEERVVGEVPDAAVLDYMLPDGDGVSLAIELLRDFPELVVLMMSGMRLEDEDYLVCRRRDIPLLTKPFLGEELIQGLGSFAALRPKAKAEGV